MSAHINFRHTVNDEPRTATPTISDRARPRLPASRILLLPVCGLGDAVCFLPFLEALRDGYPEARIVVVVATTQAGEIFEKVSPAVETQVFHRESENALVAPLSWLRKLREQRFDMVVSGGHANSWRVPLLSLMSGAKIRIGASSERLSHCYNYRASIPRGVHTVEKYRLMLASLGIEVPPDRFRPRLRVPDEAKESAARLWKEVGLATSDRVIAIASGADSNHRGRWRPTLKRWREGNYARVVRWLVEDAGMQVAIVGVREEADLAREIASHAGVEIANLCGRTSVGELQWMLQNCVALLTNDTGTGHLAAALGTPVVSLFGPTSATSFGRTGQLQYTIQGEAPCAPCFPHPTCDLRACLAMDAIQPSEVIHSLEHLLHRVTMQQADSVLSLQSSPLSAPEPGAEPN